MTFDDLGRDWKNQHKVISPAFQTKNLIRISSVVFSKVVERVFDEFKKVETFVNLVVLL